MPDLVRAWHWVNQQRHNGAADQPNAAPLLTNNFIGVAEREYEIEAV